MKEKTGKSNCRQQSADLPAIQPLRRLQADTSIPDKMNNPDISAHDKLHKMILSTGLRIIIIYAAGSGNHEMVSFLNNRVNQTPVSECGRW